MQYLELPAIAISVLAGIFLVLQIIGEIIEFKGKTAPEILKIRKYFKRRKQEKRAVKQLPAKLEKLQYSMDDFMSHYSSDNIMKRDKWIKNVNDKLEQTDSWVKEFSEKLDKNNADTLSLLIDNKRNAIIDFAAHVIDEKYPVTREQFNRAFKLYEEYEDIIEKNGLTNGEVDVAHRIITESYENHMKNHSFIENIRGYDI